MEEIQRNGKREAVSLMIAEVLVIGQSTLASFLGIVQDVFCCWFGKAAFSFFFFFWILYLSPSFLFSLMGEMLN